MIEILLIGSLWVDFLNQLKSPNLYYNARVSHFSEENIKKKMPKGLQKSIYTTYNHSNFKVTYSTNYIKRRMEQVFMFLTPRLA